MILLVTAPFTQLNTPYPATAYLKGFLNQLGEDSFQVDLGLEVMLQLLTKEGLKDLFKKVENQGAKTKQGKKILSKKEDYLDQIENVVSFLQGKNPSMTSKINSLCLLPMGPRFKGLDLEDWSIAQLPLEDLAKYIATLFLEDLADLITLEIDSDFGFSRYAERLGRSANSFDELEEALHNECSIIQQITNSTLLNIVESKNPEFICFSVPFPGNLFSTLAVAKAVKEKYSHIKIAMGGGFPNTELRSMKDPRLFNYVDFVTLDDGERPIELLIKYIKNSKYYLKRTFIVKDGEVQYLNNALEKDYTFNEVGTPDYSDLRLKEYLSVLEIANPMHRLWSDGRWNKLTMAHGCYWGKCTFCDISLDYIARYEPLSAKLIVDRMQELVAQTGITGFHFVDEAAPPKLMKLVAEEIISRNLKVTWWTNVRFEKAFTFELCEVLAKGGCIAVSGGLEVASDRLLKLIDKGITVKQVAQVCRNLTEAGIMVHAYLMYGYPTQTLQETVDSLEYVRQLFEAGIVQSGFWHQFALTAHSPIYQEPEKYNISIVESEITFANNDVHYIDDTQIDHSQFSTGLKKAMYNFLHDNGYDFPLQTWFDFAIPNTTVSPDAIEEYLA